MKILLLVFLLPLVLFSSCEKEEAVGVSQFTLNIDFEYNGQEMILFEEHDYDAAYTLKIEKLQLYLSNVKLFNETGSVVDLGEIIYQDNFLNDPLVSREIPAGNYNKIEFSVGVPQSLNGTDSPDFDAALYSETHPLSLNKGMYWTWNSGYRFVLLDGRVNTNPTIDDEFETLLSIHTGKDYSFRSKSIAINYVANADGVGSLTLVFEVSKFLAGDDDVIDIAVDNQSHGTNEDLANRLSDNVIKAIVIK